MMAVVEFANTVMVSRVFNPHEVVVGSLKDLCRNSLNSKQSDQIRRDGMLCSTLDRRISKQQCSKSMVTSPETAHQTQSHNILAFCNSSSASLSR